MAKTTPDDGIIKLDDILELSKFAERYPDVGNESRLRWWIFHRRANGIEKAGALIKRSGRWFVVAPRMKDWLLRGGAP